MAGQKRDWKKLSPEIFYLVNKGVTNAEISRKMDMPHSTLVHWWLRKGKKEFIEKYGELSKKRTVSTHKGTWRILEGQLKVAVPPDKGMILKSKLKIGSKVKFLPTLEVGTVSALYPHIFTIWTGLYTTSIMYKDADRVVVIK